MSGTGYTSAPITVLSTELDNLASSSGDVLAVSSALVNTTGAPLADLELDFGGTRSPVADAFVEIWVLRSIDGGIRYEDGAANMAPGRPADAIISVASGTNITPHAGEPSLIMPPGFYKIALRNQTGVTIPTSSILRLSTYGQSTTGGGGTGLTLPGDVAGTTAYRIADMLERFGVVTYSQSDTSVNPWGAGVSDYTTGSVISALNYITANSGLVCNLREYHVAGRDSGGGSNQLSWCPTVASATGGRFAVSLLRGAVAADATSLSNMATSSAGGTGWMAWAEGLNTPNDGSVTAANCVTVQQTLESGVATTASSSKPVGVVGPSFTYNTLPPETSTAIANYLTAQQKSDLLAASALASVRYFPTANPGANDSAGRGGNSDDVSIGHTIYFGKPEILGEFHPTQLSGDSPSRATDDNIGAYYGALMMLHAHRLDYRAWFWKSLFDIGQSGDSPWVRVGLFPNRGSDTPRLPARAIRAMYALTGDTGSSKRSFQPSNLDYAISGLPAPPASATPWMGGHHRLFQNSGGTFFLFVWSEALYPGGSGTTVTISFNRTMSKVIHYDLTTDPAAAETPVSTLTNIPSLSFSLTASVRLFVIFPQGSTIPTESAQDTTLTSTAGAIYDALGVAWTLVSNPPFGLQVAHASMVDSQNVVLLLYHDHVVHQQNNVGTWQFWNNATQAWVVEPGDPRIQITESPEGRTVNTTGQTIFASQTPGQVGGATLDAWALDSTAHATKNGVQDGATANAMELFYHNHTVYLEQTTGNSFGTPGWKFYNGSGWTDCPNPHGVVESPEGTQVTSIGPTINASVTPGQASNTLHIWGLTDPLPGEPAFRMTFDGAIDVDSWGVDLLYYHNHSLYQRTVGSNSLGSPAWYVWAGPGINNWVDTTNPNPVQGPTESTEGTTVTDSGPIIYASRTPGQASPSGAPLDQWTITSGRQAFLNGSYDGSSANVLSLYYAGHFVYHSASNGNNLGFTPGWWRWSGTAWVDVTPPIAQTQQSIAITTIPQQVVGSAFSVVGTLSGYSSPPSLQYRDGASGTFVALPAGAVVSATAFSFTHPALTSATTAAPAAAAAVGFNMRTHGPNVTLGANWKVHSPTATQNPDGSVRLSEDFYAANLNINTAGNGGNFSGVAFGGGGYFEIVFSIENDILGWGGDPTGWPAWWMNNIEGTYDNVPNPLVDQQGIEYDACEFLDPHGTPINAGIILWSGDGRLWNNTDNGQGNGIFLPGGDFTVRHRYAWLWVPATNTTQGYIKNYIDGVQKGLTYTWNKFVPGRSWEDSKNNDPWAVMDTGRYRLLVGSNQLNPMTVYSVEVWQANDSANLRVGTPLPSGSGTGSTTVSVRDAGNTSIQATSNSFNVVASGSVSLNNITLSNNTQISGAVAGTAIGTITVVVSGGLFSGTLAVNDTARFRISGSTLQNNTTLAVGNYNITITATQASASGSPLSRNFTIAVSGSGNTTINFSSPTGKTLNKALFGFSCSFFGGQQFTNATFRNTANTFLKPSALWFNSDWDLDTDFANGNMTTINALLNNYRSFCQPGVRVTMGCCKDNTVSASTRASRAANFATFLNNNGFSDILDWTIGNIWDFNGISQNTAQSYFNAVADALHGVNSSYRIWGPPQWHAGSFANSTWANAVGTTRNNGGIVWVSYDVPADNNGGNITVGLDVAYGQWGVNNQNAVIQRNALAGTSMANARFGVIEYNMAEDMVNIITINQSGRYMGGIYAACYLYGIFKSVASGVDFAHLQNIVNYNDNGAIGNEQQGGNLSAVSCAGYIIGRLGQTMFGPEYSSSTTIANLAVLSVKPTTTTFAILLINYDLANSRTVNIAVSGGVPTGTITRWEIGKSSPGAPNSPTPTTGTQSSLASVSIASETVVILTGTLA